MPTRLLVAHGEGELIFFVARHPRTSDPMMLGRRADSAILEVHRHVPPKAAKASWLVAGLEQVVQDGALYLATPIDPLLLLLPLLERARGGASSLKRESSAGLYKPLSEAFGGDEAGLEQHLTRLSGLSERLRAICDVNDKYGEPMVRLSDPLVLGWLRRKAEAELGTGPEGGGKKKVWGGASHSSSSESFAPAAKEERRPDKPAAAKKPKVAEPLKKGQKTMGAFFMKKG
ncbi:hypothetical protein EMIHUDRAFT_245820 [Emiliania huxleyi CCMP1516]|uniref:Rnh202 triple barrel domain-containing protein n=2 Tax=Emiliania huxleyi TaxID=2903 RepID=A0A0D3IW38_EMIH1|nr:hypothetical protein EMIHUDRAFT_245820 [Emiliania huxleyi CCMP1516]EOD15473.1 hypothetical protein EMIHUDRAFT_245820 [Emiliania huxleyi CCMP1516]|eukprot:XP_005767902.1 hypothetical protein EMIHUDRAFT_245820 [Emiliania huxleyi CCMP1516]